MSEEFEQTMSKMQEFAAGQISKSAANFQSAMEINTAIMKGNQAVAHQWMENYADNLNASFEGWKALSESKGVVEFYKTLGETTLTSAKRNLQQVSEMAKIAGSAWQETSEAGRNAVKRSFGSDD